MLEGIEGGSIGLFSTNSVQADTTLEYFIFTTQSEVRKCDSTAVTKRDVGERRFTRTVRSKGR